MIINISFIYGILLPLFLTLLAPICHTAAKKQSSPVFNTVELVQKKLKRSYYRLGGQRFNIARGVFYVDCSSYVDHVLRKALPSAFTKLKIYAHTKYPNSLDYYNFIKHISRVKKMSHWQVVKKVKNLQPGDIVVFRYKHLHRRISGHVMIVVNKPKLKYGKNVYELRVSDSSPYRHSHDTRKHSGIGQGDMLLKVNAKTGEPLYYAWKIGMGYSSKMRIDMARAL